MSLLDENTGMVDGLGQTQLEHLGLQAALQEVLWLETQHVIKLHAALLQHAGPHQATQQSIACWRCGPVKLRRIHSARDIYFLSIFSQ